MSKETERRPEPELNEQGLAKRARDSIRDVQLPDDVKRRLRLARAEAVKRVDGAPAGAFIARKRWLLPAGAVASLILAVILVGNHRTDVMPVLDELELAAATDMDLLEDMEFLAWMLEEESSKVVPDDS